MLKLPLAALCAMLLLLAGCMSIDIDGPSPCRDKAWAESTLYLGRTMNTKPVSDEAWRTFVETDVTPKFPDGFTYTNARGAWYNSVFKQTLYEDSTMLIILHADTDENRRKIEDVARAYRATFNQQAVLRARKSVCVAFITE